MSVSLDEVRRIALLARLAVPDERGPALVAQLNGILAHMEVLQQLPDDPSDLTAATLGMRLAADHGPATGLHRPPGDLAPSFRDGFFLVPRLATHDAAGTVAAEDES
jgi:aspartyl-tRNA(Asn)/glutamyl-tRNA(Gln) amidotransferase subunit C